MSKVYKELILNIIAVISIIFNVLLILELSASGWFALLIFTGIPIISNVGNVVLAKQVYKKTLMSPLLLLLYHLSIEVVVIILATLNNIRMYGRPSICLDGCSATSSIGMFLYLFFYTRICFIGGHVYYIVKHFTKRKKEISQPDQNQTPSQV